MLMFEKTFPLVGLAMLLVLYLVSPAVAEENATSTETSLECYECKDCKNDRLKPILCNGTNPACSKTIHLASKVANAGCAEFKQACEYIDGVLKCHCQNPPRCNEDWGPTPDCNCAPKSIECYECHDANDCTTPQVKRPCPGIKPACVLHQNLETKKVEMRGCVEFTKDCEMLNKTIMACQCEDNICNEGVPASCKCGNTNTGTGPGGNPPTPNSAEIEALSPVLGIATALIVAVIQDYHFFLRSTFPN